MSQNATPATEFAPCHHCAQRWQCDSQKTRNTTRPKCCACYAKWHRRSPKCCSFHESKMQRILWKYGKSIAPARQNDFWNVTKCHACHAKWSMRRWKAPKVSPFCRTYHRHGHSGLTRTLANGCGRLRAVADGCGRRRNVWRTQLNPHTSRVKGEPLLRIREKTSANSSRKCWGCPQIIVNDCHMSNRLIHSYWPTLWFFVTVPDHGQFERRDALR